MKRKFLTILVIFFLPLLHCDTSFALTMAEAVNTALKNNPSIQEKSQQVLVQKETLAQQSKKQSPTLSADASYLRKTTENSSSAQQNGTYNTGLTLEQLLADSGKTLTNIQVAHFNLLSSQYDLQTAENDLIKQTIEAYWTVLLNKGNITIAKRKYENFEKRKKWAESFYKIGTKAKIEVTNANSDLATSKAELIKYETKFEASRQKLAQLLSIDVSDIKDLEENLVYRNDKYDTSTALERAIKQRPEILSQKALLAASRENLTLQKKGYSPSLSASLNYNFGGVSYFDTDQWTAKISAAMPLFDGGITNSKIREAKAKQDIAENKLREIEDTVKFEVGSTIVTMTQSDAAYTASLEAEHAAEESLKLAGGRYKAGTGNSLEISDAIEKLANAQYNSLQALYTFRASQVAYLRAIGERYNEN